MKKLMKLAAKISTVFAVMAMFVATSSVSAGCTSEEFLSASFVALLSACSAAETIGGGISG